jgi:radical SAM superfamily enzyme YgiQ (UPF0313 family)
MIPEPLELEIVAAHLRNLGHVVDLVDLVLQRRPLRWFVSRKQYDIVGFTAYINHVQVVKHLARDIKRVSPRTQVVVGGIHAESVPTDFVDASIDHIVWANGVITMGRIASGMSAAEAACLPGVWGSGKAKPAVEHPQGLMPDRTITAKYRNRYTYIHHERSASLKMSYGCEAPCGTFCTHDGSYAERDLDEVMDELAGWGRADFDRLIDFLHQLEPAMVNVQPVTPMPGTRHYDDERKRLSQSRRRYIRHRYGKRVYRRMLRGAMGNTWQYLKLMVRPG